jgi:gliding-associated putative ABC transporter substrate-binding component GldG
MVNLESKKLEDILKLVNGLVLLILLNLFISNNFFRLDLTEEKRFSISTPTKDMLSNLDDNVYVEVYLEGDLPAGFKRLQIAIKETLEEFRVYSDNKVQYSFIDPELASTAQSRDEYMMSIAEKGIQPTDIFLTENGNKVQKRILPGAVITYGLREKGVSLLKGNKGTSSDNQLNQSAEGIEYQLASVIKALSRDTQEVIGFTSSHGELTGNDIIGLTETLSERFIVREINQIDPQEFTGIDLLIMTKPENRFSAADKYNIDQYIMSGRNMIFLIDGVRVESDTVSIAFPYDLNLDDQLFKYGVRINKDLVQDMFSLSEPIVVGTMGDQPQIEMLPWPFFTLINTFAEHPIVRNLDAISTNYVNSIDTVKAEGVMKTPLLFTSPYSRTLQAPLRIELNELKKPIDAEAFTKSNIPIGYLLEGNFTSVFKNRPLPTEADKNSFLEEGQSAIIVISDGDLARNKFDPQTGSPLPLGYDYYSRQTFANEDFLLNAVQYLLDDQGLIQSRNKEIVLRPLDKVKVQAERFKWQVINLVLPIIVLVGYGLISNFYRKRKYSSF